MPARPALRQHLALGAALLLLSSLAASAHDASGEYFIGDDPGVGIATPIPAPSGVPPSYIHDLALPVPASPGAGLMIGLRFRNAAGQWGATNLQWVYLLAATAPAAAEWAWGGDFNAGTSTATPTVGGTLALTRPSSLAGDAAADPLALRARANGLVGHASFRQVSPFGGSPPARLYYAIDRSPDPATAASDHGSAPGTAAFVPLTAEHAASPVTVPLSLGDLAPGFHSLHLQLHDANGARTQSIRYLHVTPSSVQTLAGLAYTFRNSAGVMTAIQVAPITLSSASQDVSLPVPATLAQGDYTLVLNLAAAASNLGFSTSASVGLTVNYDTWAAVALAGLPSGQTGMLADADSDGLVNLLEYACGLDPRTAGHTPPYTVSIAEVPVGTILTIRYRQREGGVGEPGADYTAAGLRYKVEASTDLQIWGPYTQVSAGAGSYSRTSNGDGTETVSLDFPTQSALDYSGKVFVRLNISVAP